ncbi:MAG TPA: hypothetical protein VFU47_09635, partial [Armatimonadota bacterium]|nr:hypothetical protein [Armatimonadota bacterium]
EEALVRLHDADTGKPLVAHGGTVYWNAYRKRWIMIAVEIGGTSMLGEVWYAEAETPLGPWLYARKVATHDRYSFYNPAQHPEFDQQGGRLVYFEGTYTNSFSGNPDRTPRYDYNQVMYRLDLADPRLHLPVAFYRSADGPPFRAGASGPRPQGRPEFFALDRPAPGTVPISWRDGRLTAGAGAGTPLFHALPAAASAPPATTVPLYEWTGTEDGSRRYAPADEAPGPSFRRAEEPLCRVWKR